MVQVIQRSPRDKTFAEQLMEGLSSGLKAGAELAGPIIQKRQLSKALQELGGLYSSEGKDLSEQQRLIQAYQKLAGFPEIAGRLGSQLSSLGEQERKSFYQRLTEEEEKKKLSQAFQNVQNIYADPNMSPDLKTIAIYEQFAQNPALAKALTGSLETTDKKRGLDIAGEQFAKGYDAILAGDNEALQGVIDDPSTPIETKIKLTDLRNQTEVRKGVEARELRSRQSLVSRSYDRAISQEQNNLKVTPYGKRGNVQEKIKKLEALKRRDLNALAKDPNSYTNLKLWNYLDPEMLEEIEDETFEDVFQPAETSREKVKFDPKNPSHVARAKEILAQVGGDRNQANLILAEEFTK